MTKKKLTISLELGDDFAGSARRAVSLAEKTGFSAAWLSDHYMPWVDTGGQAGAVWPTLAACFEQTRKIKLGPLATTPIGGRYHPAYVAQTCGTLDKMYPGRLRLAVGAGEAINEAVFLNLWPSWKERSDRLMEAIRLIRALWENEHYFDFAGEYFAKGPYFLYEKPRTRMKILVSCFGKRSARLAGLHGDGLTTVSARCPFETCKNTLFPSFDSGASEGGKNPQDLAKVVTLSYTFASEEAYLRAAQKTDIGRLAPGALDREDPRRIEKNEKRVVPKGNTVASRILFRVDRTRRTHFPLPKDRGDRTQHPVRV